MGTRRRRTDHRIRAMVRLVVGVVVAVLLCLGLVWALQRHLIYFPATAPVPAAASVLPGARDVVLETDDGLALGAWFLPGREPSRGIAVLVANGNGGDRSGRAPLAEGLAAE